MDYLTMVQEAIRLSGVRSASPTTLAGSLEITADFAGYVQDTWRELQEESKNWWFRQKLDQTIQLTPPLPLSSSLVASENISPDPTVIGAGSWTLGSFPTPWSLSATYGQLTCDGTGASTKTAGLVIPDLESNQRYYVECSTRRNASSCTIKLDDQTVGTVPAGIGTVSGYVTTGTLASTAYLWFEGAAGFDGYIDTAYVVPVSNYGDGDEYTMPTDLETLNYRTLTAYTTAKTDETPVRFMRYEDWRHNKDTVDTSAALPTVITERPDGVLQIWPVPDKYYKLRYDGVWDIDVMSSDTDTPGSTITGGTQLLPDRYHYVLVYGAVVRWYEHHEDPEGLAKAQAKFLAQHARLKEVQAPPVYVPAGVLTGAYGSYRRFY